MASRDVRNTTSVPADGLAVGFGELSFHPKGHLRDHVQAWQRQREHEVLSGRELNRVVSRLRDRVVREAGILAATEGEAILEWFCSAPNTAQFQFRWSPPKLRERIQSEVSTAASSSLSCLAQEYLPDRRLTLSRFIVAHVLISLARQSEDNLYHLDAALDRRRRLIRTEVQSRANSPVTHAESRSERVMWFQRLWEIRRDVSILTRERAALHASDKVRELKTYGRGIAALSLEQRSEYGKRSGQRLRDERRGLFGLSADTVHANAVAGGHAKSARKWTPGMERSLSELVAKNRHSNGRIDWIKIHELWAGPQSLAALEHHWGTVLRDKKDTVE